MKGTDVAFVLSGGVALGAYQAGAYAAVHDALGERVKWLAGSSIGAVNAAIIAGNEPRLRAERLSGFWHDAASVMPGPLAIQGSLRHSYNWLSVLRTRLVGQPQLFLMRPPWFFEGISLYDLSPLADRLHQLVDFERLNAGEVRLSVVATDIGTGEPVIFDTARGDSIGSDHLLASCGFLPDFEPTQVNGRLMGDGALVANAPVEVVLGGALDDDLVCFVIDVFAPDAGVPRTLEDAAELRRDLLLANQTQRALEAIQREDRLRRLLAKAAETFPALKRNDPSLAAISAEARRSRIKVLHLSYRAVTEEAGPEKQFDFSQVTLSERSEAGAADMARALEWLDSCTDDDDDGFSLHRIRR